MQHAIGVTETNSGQHLSHKGSYRGHGESNPFRNIVRGLVLIQKGLQIECNKLKDEIESSRMCLNDIQEFDDIWMVEFSK